MDTTVVEGHAVCVGLCASEAVLRGGHLKTPEVFANLVYAEGKKWVQLDKKNMTLAKFLCGKKQAAR